MCHGECAMENMPWRMCYGECVMENVSWRMDHNEEITMERLGETRMDTC